MTGPPARGNDGPPARGNDGPPARGNDRLLEIGRVVRAHGLRGQVIVELWTNRPERVAEGARLLGPSGELTITRSAPSASSGGRERRLLGFEQLGSREAAEGLRGAVLRAEAVVDDDALWVHDLVGSQVYTTAGDLIGRVESVEANPASDLLVLEDGRLIPLTFVTEQGVDDNGERRLTVDVPAGLLDL